MNPSGCSDGAEEKLQVFLAEPVGQDLSLSFNHITVPINVSVFMMKPRTQRNHQKQILYYYDDPAETGHKKAGSVVIHNYAARLSCVSKSKAAISTCLSIQNNSHVNNVYLCLSGKECWSGSEVPIEAHNGRQGTHASTF